MPLAETALLHASLTVYPEPQLCTSFKLGNNSLRKAATSGKSDILKSLLLLQQIVAFSSVYFISVTALDVITNVGAIDDLTSTARLVMLLPVAFLDAIFILWVFTSLSATLRSLQSRNTTVKLQLYRRFTNALAAWVWISAAWVAYEMYTKVAAAVLSSVDVLLQVPATRLGVCQCYCDPVACSLACVAEHNRGCPWCMLLPLHCWPVVNQLKAAARKEMDDSHICND